MITILKLYVSLQGLYEYQHNKEAKGDESIQNLDATEIQVASKVIAHEISTKMRPYVVLFFFFFNYGD